MEFNVLSSQCPIRLLQLLLLFRHSAKGSNAQEERLTTSRKLVTERSSIEVARTLNRRYLLMGLIVL